MSLGISQCRLLCAAAGLVFATTVAVVDAQPANAQAQLESGSAVQFADGYLSVDVENVSLEALLREIAAKANLALMLSGRLEERISIAFNALPLDKALQRLLRNHSFALEYSEAKDADKKTGVLRPSILWVHSGTTKNKSAEVPYTAHVSEESQRAATAVVSEDPDPSDRGAAVEALADKRDATSIPTLRLALRDPDQQVREAAIAALVEIGGDEAANALADVLADNEPWLREVAVTALGQIGGDSAIRLLQQALSDDDDSVKDLAAATLEQLKH